MANRIGQALKIFLLVVLIVGIILSFGDMRGWFQDKDKLEVLDWALHSLDNLPLDHPGATKFVKVFPPPSASPPAEIVCLTKTVVKLENGPIQSANIRYLNRDSTQTAYVATLPDIQAWATATAYPVWALVVLVVAFFLSVGNYIIERVKDKR